MAQYKSYTHVLRIDKDEVQGILCGDVVVMPKLDGTNAGLFMKDGTVHAGSRTREINMNKDNANFCKTLTLNGEKEFPQIIKYLESHPDHMVYPTIGTSKATQMIWTRLSTVHIAEKK